MLSGIYSTLFSSVTMSVTSQMLCVSGVSPVCFLTVLALLPNAVVSSSASSCSQPSTMLLHVTACLVIFLYMMLLTGLSPMLSLYFRNTSKIPAGLMSECVSEVIELFAKWQAENTTKGMMWNKVPKHVATMQVM